MSAYERGGGRPNPVVAQQNYTPLSPGAMDVAEAARPTAWSICRPPQRGLRTSRTKTSSALRVHNNRPGLQHFCHGDDTRARRIEMECSNAFYTNYIRHSAKRQCKC
jgi:hypothetical protein